MCLNPWYFLAGIVAGYITIHVINYLSLRRLKKQHEEIKKFYNLD